MIGECEMCRRKSVELVGFGICAPCDALDDNVSELLYRKYTHVSPKDAFRYFLTKDHEVNARGDHPSNQDTCVNMHADCTHE